MPNTNNFKANLKQVLSSNNYNYNESSAYLSFDTNYIKQLRLVSKQYKNKFSNVVVIGIGGSNLGTKAIYKTCKSKNTKPIYFLENINERTIKRIAAKITNKTAIVFVSKSGNTTEPHTNLTALNTIKKINSSNLFVITNSDTKLNTYCLKNNIKVYNIPNKVGGRYSVFSYVGMLPLILANFNYEKLLQGAREAVKDFLTKDTHFKNTLKHFKSYKKGTFLYNLFCFNKVFLPVLYWNRQLYAESLGKDNKGILPIITLGQRDLHSVGQFYFGSKNYIYTHFLYLKPNTNIKFTNSYLNIESTKILYKKDTNLVQNAIYKGVVRAYKKSKLPYMQTQFSQFKLKDIAYFMQVNMLKVMYLAKLIGVNAFDQPNVETYKQETKKVLKTND